MPWITTAKISASMGMVLFHIRLNITVPPTPLAALVFDNCLRNGEPDERTLHEGIEPSGGAVKCERFRPSPARPRP